MGRKILLIEDDRETASYLAKGLNQEGHSVEQATNGQDGLFRATDGSFDLIILDRMLPVLDGLSVLKALRAAQIGTPVLILSALASVGDRIEGLECGSDDYLVKPFSFAELLARVNALLRRRESRRRPGRAPADRRRPRDRSAVAQREARRQEARPQAARISAARIFRAQRRPRGHPHHAARAGLGLSFRSRAPTSSTSMSAGFAASSTKGSKSRCCTPCAARATCSPPERAKQRPCRRRLRIALLAGLLALLSNLAVIGFIYLRTHDEAVVTVHRQVVEQGKVLADVYRSGGKPALDDAIEDTMTYADPQTAIALLDADGRQIDGQSRDPAVDRAAAAGRLSQRAHPAARPDRRRARQRWSSIGCRPGSGSSAAASPAKASRSARRSSDRC